MADFTPFTRLKAVLSLWAGVERIVGDPTLTVPLCRMVDPGLTRGMVEWVAAHVLRYHLGTDAHVLGQDGVWRHGVVPPLAPERTVAVLGLGELGRAVAAALPALGFDVRGLEPAARSDLPGMRTLRRRGRARRGAGAARDPGDAAAGDAGDRGAPRRAPAGAAAARARG